MPISGTISSMNRIDLRTDPEVVAGLERISTPVEASKGTLLFRQGERVKGVYVIKRGRVLLSMSRGTKRMKYRTVGPGYVIGLPATLTGQPYSLTAEVMQKVELGFVPRAEAFQFLENDPELCIRLIDFLGRELAWLREHKIMLVMQSTRRRRPRK
jgi:CRP/FNR family cyclic AMP-dependent transcriptional regulator